MIKLVNLHFFFAAVLQGRWLGPAWVQHVCKSYPQVNFNLAGTDNEAPAWLCGRGCFLGGWITDIKESGTVFLLLLLSIVSRLKLTLVHLTALQLCLHFLCGKNATIQHFMLGLCLQGNFLLPFSNSPSLPYILQYFCIHQEMLSA